MMPKIDRKKYDTNPGMRRIGGRPDRTKSVPKADNNVILAPHEPKKPVVKKEMAEMPSITEQVVDILGDAQFVIGCLG